MIKLKTMTELEALTREESALKARIRKLSNYRVHLKEIHSECVVQIWYYQDIATTDEYTLMKTVNKMISISSELRGLEARIKRFTSHRIGLKVKILHLLNEN